MWTNPTAVGTALFLALIVLGCDFPRDAAGTLDRLRAGGELRVGVSEDAPWIRLEGDEPHGIEATLIRSWAGRLGARIQWVHGSEAEMVDALEHREIDVLAAGLTDDTPWSSKMGVSRPYFRTRLCVGRPEGGPAAWKGQPVTVERGDAHLAALVRSKGGLPIPSGDGEHRAPVFRAGYDFQLVDQGLIAADPCLREEKHILAVAPGESALLLDLDRFLQTTGPSVWSIALEEARR